MKKRLLRQLCRALNLSADFIRRYKRLFKALLEGDDGSGSGSSGTHNPAFVPTNILLQTLPNDTLDKIINSDFKYCYGLLSDTNTYVIDALGGSQILLKSIKDISKELTENINSLTKSYFLNNLYPIFCYINYGLTNDETIIKGYIEYDASDYYVIIPIESDLNLDDIHEIGIYHNKGNLYIKYED